MRDAFHDDLDSIRQMLIEMGNMVGHSMAEATTALLEVDLALAEQVISDDVHIDNVQHELDAKALTLLARQQPVAGDLRTLITSLRMSADLERMGDLTTHIAKVARMRFPEKAVPAELEGTVREMGRVAGSIIAKATSVIESHNLEDAIQLEKDDDEMDKLHRKLFLTLLDDSWSHGIEVAIDMTLLGRYYERCADHAVSVARRVYFLVTGEYASDLI
jgi:phosphate transport system protein